ncbi:MAG: penicillin acylase family protein [Burkholderiaceae bacterium]
MKAASSPRLKPIARLIRLACWGSGLAGLALAGVGAVLSVSALRSLPQTQGTAALAGLSAPVNVQRDAADVTHIQAQTPLDALRALGMVHAQERAWQLEFNRRVLRGDLSEVFGPATLDTDKLMRTLGIRQAAQAQWDGLPVDVQAALQAYAQGVNAHMAKSVGQGGQGLTPEFTLLGINPREAAVAGDFWHPTDSLGWAIMMALDLGGNWGNEFARLSALQVLDTPGLWQLFPPYPGEAPAATADLAALYRQLGVYKTGAEKPIQTSAGGNFGSKITTHALTEDITAWAADLGNVEGKGSNNWVVDGSRTQSGKPLLANDPHLGLTAPAIWYFARLQAPAAGDQGALDVVGATLPGMPFVVLGRTAHMAWGFTNTGPDVQDLYLEQINPAQPGQYRVPAASGKPDDVAWADFATRSETIRVKGQPDVTHTVRSTRHGPVLSDAQASHAKLLDTSRYVLALRWTALDADNQTVRAGLGLNRAHTVAQGIEALRHNHSPTQNVVLADTAGAVAYKAAGKIPVRSPLNTLRGVAPSPGWDARYDWQGWLPYEDTPQSIGAGPQGWLATANQRIHAADYPHFITQDWAVPYRQQRIEALLQATPRHTPDSMQALQADQLSLATQHLLPVLQATPSSHPLAAAAQQALNNFDGVMRADQAAPLIFTAWVDTFTRQVIGGRLGQERFAPLYGKRQFRNAVEDILARDDKAWCGEGGCTAASTRALDEALTTLAQRHGPRVDGWRWGAAHPAVSRHNPFSKVKPLASLFEVRVPTGGDPFTVNVGQYQLDNPAEPYANRHAASLRAVYDLANLDNSRFIYQTGQSGNVWSPRYCDMVHEWAAVRYRPLQLQPAKWVSQLTVKP